MKTLMRIVLGRAEPMAADYLMALALVLSAMGIILTDLVT